jgi:hypothetical protein
LPPNVNLPSTFKVLSKSTALVTFKVFSILVTPFNKASPLKVVLPLTPNVLAAVIAPPK